LPIIPIIAKDERVRTLLPLALVAPFAIALLASQGSAQSDIADQQRRLIEARAQSAAAARRSASFDQAAAAERNEAARAAAQEQAQAAKVQKAEADIAAATARIALVDRLLNLQQANLAQQQGPIARLIAALATLAMRPGAVSLIQPGSLDDLVHVRAVLGSTLPLVQARTAGLRSALDRARRLRADQALAMSAMARGRADLETQRVALARIEADHRLKSQDLGRNALAESDRAIGLGERARDLVDAMRVTTDATTTGRALTALSGPLPRPPRPGDVAPVSLPWTATSAPYRLPVEGRLVTGFYGQVVIIDHYGGWSSLISGLGTLRVRAGDRLAQGALIGVAAGGSAPQVTVELRRRGRPVDLAPLTG
jgi:murein hydrolase activator